MFDLAESELDMIVSSFLSIITGFGNHGRCHIDTDDSPGLTCFSSCEKTVETTAAAKVKYRFSRPDTSYRTRVAAAEPHVGTLRYLIKVLFAVPQAGRDQGIDRCIVGNTAAA